MDIDKVREYKIRMLMLFTGWERAIFKHFNDQEIDRLYRERVQCRQSTTVGKLN